MRRLKKILQVTMIINAYLNAIDQDLAAINVLENAFNAKAGNVILTTMYVIIWWNLISIANTLWMLNAGNKKILRKLNVESFAQEHSHADISVREFVRLIAKKSMTPILKKVMFHPVKRK